MARSASFLDELKSKLKKPSSSEEEGEDNSRPDSREDKHKNKVNRIQEVEDVKPEASSSLVRKQSSLSRKPSFLRKNESHFIGKKSNSPLISFSKKLPSVSYSRSVSCEGKRSSDVEDQEQDNGIYVLPKRNIPPTPEIEENEYTSYPIPRPRHFSKNPSKDQRYDTKRSSAATEAEGDDYRRPLHAHKYDGKRQSQNQSAYRMSIKFEKRESDDLSTDYRNYVFAYYAFLLATDDAIEDFEMWSNEEDFGVFEDIIFQVETNNRLENFAIHCVASAIELSPETLSRPDGKFSLKQHFKSYQKLPEESSDLTFVLLTPKSFIDEHQEVRIETGGEIIRAKVVRSRGPSLLHKCCYKCEIISQTNETLPPEVISKYLEYKEFFNKFVIWCEYPNLKTLKVKLHEEMKERCDCDKISEKFIKYVTKWIAQEGIVQRLTKSSILKVLVLRLVDGILHPLVFGSVNNKAILLQEVISQFNVTVFDENLVDYVTALWGDIDEELQNSEIVQLLNDQHHICSDITKMDNIEKTKLLWTMDMCPLILKDHIRCETVINLFKNGNFVVLGRGINVPSECSAFRKLSDFDLDSELCKELTSSFEYSFAGKNVPLSFFPGSQYDYEDIVTPSHLIQMVYEPYTIEIKKEELPTPYIPRLISRNIIDYKYLETINHETVVLISNVTNRTKIEKFAKQGCEYSLAEKNSKFNLWIVEKECSQEDFKQLCRVNKTKRRCHHFCERDGRLEWLKTEGDLDLEPFRIEGHFAEESSLSNFDSNVIIIVDEAGKGKSVLLKRLANVLPDFTVYLSSSEISALCQETLTKEKLQKFVAKTKFPTMTEFDKVLLKLFFNKHKVVFLWDGLDEISSKNFNVVTNFINDLKDFVHFITCRPHLKTLVETKCTALSRYLAQFNPTEMKRYMQERLQVAFPESSEDEFNKLNKTLSYLQVDNFVKVPIQLFMVTELFIKNVNVLDKLVSIADLYNYFVDERLKESYKEHNLSYDNDYDFRKEQIEIYQKAALISIFDNAVLSKLGIQLNNLTDNFGFFTWVSGKPQFLHYSYAEYFVATYFVKHRARFPDLLYLLFEESYTNVRFFFDVILAEKSVPHLAVLYKNIDVLKQHSNLKIKDAGGRNVLQLACSWGQRYPELSVTTVAHKYIIDEDSDFVVKDDVQYKQILELLLNMIDTNEKDEVFRMDALGYACSTKSIYAILSIIQKNNLQQHKQITLVNYLYYATRLGFSTIINTYKDTKLIEMGNGNTLLHVAAENSQLQCVQILLNQPKYLKCINQRGKNGETPLHVAARAGDYKITQLLINSGGDINAINDQNQTPIFCAAANNCYHVVTRLITLGANTSLQDIFGRSPLSYSCEKGFTGVVEVFRNKTDFNALDKTGWSPLFYAARNGREDVVEMLVQWGALVDITDKFGKSPLGLACEYGHANIAKLLIEAGANVNSADKVVGWTPIFYAAKNGHQEVIQILIRNGARVDVMDKVGSRLIDYIKEPAIKMLLRLN